MFPTTFWLQTPNSEVTYELTIPGQSDRTALDFFGIKKETGEVFITQPLTNDVDGGTLYNVSSFF